MLFVVLIMVSFVLPSNSGVLLKGILQKFVTVTDQIASTPHEAPDWFKLLPIPSIKAKYFIPGPFQPIDSQTPFKRNVRHYQMFHLLIVVCC